MSVAPFLPRTGVPYIPRPALDITSQIAGAGAVDISVGNITSDRADGKVTLRLFDPSGVRLHDLSANIDETADEALFTGVTIATPGPHRVVALTSLGQVGRKVVDTTPPPTHNDQNFPTIIGDMRVGETVTADPGADDWTGSPTFTYRWMRMGVAVPGAVGPTYTFIEADIGASFDVEVTGTNAGGSLVVAGDTRGPVVAALFNEPAMEDTVASVEGDPTASIPMPAPAPAPKTTRTRK